MDSESPTAPTNDPQRVTEAGGTPTWGTASLSDVTGEALPGDYDPWGEAGDALTIEETLDDGVTLEAGDDDGDAGA